nr:TonB-dependent receptor [Prevotella sp.]
MIKMYIAAALLVAVVPAQAITELSDTSKIHDIDEVVIVSQPKEIYSLRRQAVSSTALGGNELSLLGVRDLREISSYVPSFVMPDYGSRYTSSIYIRGIGSRVNNPAVAIYSDGIPLMSKSAFNTHTYQLDRVDILRGPQGTLYGQNAEGGIIRLYSKNPMNYQGTDVKLSIGSHLWRNTEFATYKKFNNKFAMSLAGFYDGQNGFFRNVGTGERADKMNEAGGKLRFVYQPTSRLSLNFIADYQYVNQNGFPYGVLDKETGETASTNTTYQSKYRRNMFNAGFDLGFLGNYFDFHSVTSYQYLKDYMLMDQDYLPEDYMHLEQRQFQNAFTQDFSLKSIHPVGGFWHWTLGAFFSAQWLKTDGPVYFGDAMTSTIAKAMMTSPIITSCSVEMGAPGVYHTPQQNLAFYHESNFDITPRLVATLGLRFDYNHTKIEYLSSAYMRVMMTMN